MIENNSTRDIVIKLTKKTDQEQKKSLRIFVKMPIESKIEVLAIQQRVSTTLAEQNRDVALPVLSLVSIIIAIDEYSNNVDDIDKNAIALKVATLVQTSKRDMLLDNWNLVKELKNNKKLSFRQISQYFKKYLKLTVGFSSIHKLWIELEEEK